MRYLQIAVFGLGAATWTCGSPSNTVRSPDSGAAASTTAATSESVGTAGSPAPAPATTGPARPLPTGVHRAPMPPGSVSNQTPKAPGVEASTDSRSTDSTHLARLEAEARALAKTTGCSSDAQCRNVAVGIKACGGPRYYLPYCAASTDTVALFARLAELRTAERAYNAKYHIVSTCMMIMPPRPHVERGSCR